VWHQLKAIFRRDKLRELRTEEAAIRGRLAGLAEDYAKKDPRPEPEIRVLKRKLVARVASWAMFAAVILVGVLVLAYWIFDKPLTEGGLDLANMTEVRTRFMLRRDERTMTAVIDGIDRLEDEAVKLQAEFFNGQRSFTTQGDNDAVRELMRRYLAYRESLLRILWKYQRYAEIEDERLRLRAFLLEFTAASTLYQASLKFVNVFGDQSEAVAKLNEPEPNWGIPPGLYTKIRRNLASRRNINMYEFARRYYRQPHVQQQLKDHQLAGVEPYEQFHQAIADADKTIRMIDDSLTGRIVEVAISDLGRLLKKVQYETQSTVSTWIGDFKIRQPRNGESLINAEQLSKLSAVLQPGDVLLERRNWYLSNAFLPGYWPHGAVYVGTADDLRKRGLDKNPHVAKHWEEFIAKDEDGHEHVIIEAISEGVVFSSLEHSVGGADSVAVLRPRVSEEEKNEAIARAFSFAGRPYDFEFDFKSTDMLVCTEVVFRSYGGNSGPIQFPLEQIMGRTTMPAINLVKKYNDEHDSDDAQFEFVALIKGDELTGTSEFHTDDAVFRATLDLPASSFLQRSDPYSLRSIGPLGWVLLALTVLA
ncbi:MAG: hypothetical protein MI757_13090, partial [Pirellulales bacterium]|nr:hypothetical protein [Pirellulales bacterium]